MLQHFDFVVVHRDIRAQLLDVFQDRRVLIKVFGYLAKLVDHRQVLPLDLLELRLHALHLVLKVSNLSVLLLEFLLHLVLEFGRHLFDALLVLLFALSHFGQFLHELGVVGWGILRIKLLP